MRARAEPIRRTGPRCCCACTCGGPSARDSRPRLVELTPGEEAGHQERDDDRRRAATRTGCSPPSEASTDWCGSLRSTAAKRRHTSFASVDVTPEVEEDVEVEINPDDLRIDTYRSSGAGGQHVNVTDSAVRITHLPTGDRRRRARTSARRCRTARSRCGSSSRVCLQKAREEREAEMEALRGEKREIGFGSQIRSYVLHPYQMVKDHRTAWRRATSRRSWTGISTVHRGGAAAQGRQETGDDLTPARQRGCIMGELMTTTQVPEVVAARRRARRFPRCATSTSTTSTCRWTGCSSRVPRRWISITGGRRQNWSTQDLDFTRGRRAVGEHDGLFEGIRTELQRSFTLFFVGEQAVTDTLSPLVHAAPDEPSRIFLSTQLVDEARHAVFFSKFFDEVDRDLRRADRGPRRCLQRSSRRRVPDDLRQRPGRGHRGRAREPARLRRVGRGHHRSTT